MEGSCCNMMDIMYLSDAFGGFSEKHTSRETHIAASACNHAASAISDSEPRLKCKADETDSANLPVDGSAEKKKRAPRIVGGGLRQFSNIVRKKLESKGRTTYSEIADEIMTEFTGAQSATVKSVDEFDEKNIRRRVYDALNVLMAMDIITKDKREIQWKGLPRRNIQDLEDLKAQHLKLTNSTGKKAAYLKDLEEQIAGLESLILRNQKSLKHNTGSREGFILPFILVQTSPQATVEIEISEDMQLVHFDFNSTPFSLHDDSYILKLMQSYKLLGSSSSHSASSSCIVSRGTNPITGTLNQSL